MCRVYRMMSVKFRFNIPAIADEKIANKTFLHPVHTRNYQVT